MEEVRVLEKAISDLAFDNLLKQKAIDQECYSLQAWEKALDMLKHEDSNLTIERNEHKKTETLLEVQSKNCTSHLNSLGDSCLLMEEKTKVLLEEVGIMEDKYQELCTSLKEELIGYEILHQGFVATYEKLQDAVVNKSIELNVMFLKKKILDFKEKLDSITFELKRNECLQGCPAVISDEENGERQFFFSLGRSFFKRGELERQIKESLLHNVQKSSKNDFKTAGNRNVESSKKFIMFEPQPPVMSEISKVSNKLSPNPFGCTLKLDSPPLLGVAKIGRSNRTYQEANFALSQLHLNNETSKNKMNVAANIKKLKLDTGDNMFSLSFTNENKGKSKLHFPKKEPHKKSNIGSYPLLFKCDDIQHSVHSMDVFWEKKDGDDMDDSIYLKHSTEKTEKNYRIF